MKKFLSTLLVAALTLALVVSIAGCGSKKQTADASESPSSAETASPSDEQGTKPSVNPAASTEPSAETSAEPSASPSSKPTSEPSAKPSAKPSAEPSPSPKGSSGKDYAALGSALLESDGLGKLKLRTSESDLKKLLGEPESKTDMELWASDGINHASWSYPSKGLEIGMAQQPDDTEAYIFSITATAPCDLATTRGIKLGSTKADVLSAYKNEIDLDANDDTDSWITIGSVYGGLGVGIESGVVTYIFIGAAAE